MIVTYARLLIAGIDDLIAACAAFPRRRFEEFEIPLDRPLDHGRTRRRFCGGRKQHRNWVCGYGVGWNLENREWRDHLVPDFRQRSDVQCGRCGASALR